MSRSAASPRGDGHIGAVERYRRDVSGQRIEPTRERRTRSPRLRHPGRVAIIAGGLLLVVALGVGAVNGADTSDLQTAEPVPAEVESFSPAQGARVGPTSSLNVDLRDDLVGEFLVCAPLPTDCTPIPLDQTNVVPATGKVAFKPTEDSDITGWAPGPVRVTVNYHLAGSTVTDAGSFTWTFLVSA